MTGARHPRRLGLMLKSRPIAGGSRSPVRLLSIPGRGPTCLHRATTRGSSARSGWRSSTGKTRASTAARAGPIRALALLRADTHVRPPYGDRGLRPRRPIRAKLCTCDSSFLCLCSCSPRAGLDHRPAASIVASRPRRVVTRVSRPHRPAQRATAARVIPATSRPRSERPSTSHRQVRQRTGLDAARAVLTMSRRK